MQYGLLARAPHRRVREDDTEPSVAPAVPKMGVLARLKGMVGASMPSPAPTPAAPAAPAPGASAPPGAGASPHRPPPVAPVVSPPSAAQRSYPKTRAPQTPEGQQAYHEALTGLEQKGVRVQDKYGRGQDLPTRASAMQDMHGVLSQVHETLPWASHMATHYGLTLEPKDLPYQKPWHPSAGMYSPPGSLYNKTPTPRVSVHNGINGLAHEYTHFLDDALGDLSGAGSLDEIRKGQRAASQKTQHPLHELVQEIKATPQHQELLRQQGAGWDPKNFTQGGGGRRYLGGEQEVLARMTAQLIEDAMTAKHGQEPYTPKWRGGHGLAPFGERFTPEQLQYFGNRLRDIVSHHALRLGHPWERVGGIQSYTQTPEGETMQELRELPGYGSRGGMAAAPWARPNG